MGGKQGTCVTPGWSLAVSTVLPPVLWRLPTSTLRFPEAISLSTGPEHSSSLDIVKVAEKRKITVPRKNLA